MEPLVPASSVYLYWHRVDKLEENTITLKLQPLDFPYLTLKKKTNLNDLINSAVQRWDYCDI